MTSWRETAFAIREQQPELSHREIAELCGVQKAAVTKLFNPNSREWTRRSNAKRAAAKRAWENANDRPTCACGNPMAVGAHRKGFTGCWDCERSRRAAAKEERLQEIARMWAEGLSLTAIGERVGGTQNSIGTAISQARARGDQRFPHRHRLDAHGRRVA
jgi:hypothetical protein